MKMMDVLTRVKGKPVTVKDAIDFLKLSGVFRNAIFQLIEKEVIHLAAEELAVVLTDEEVEQFIDSKRRMQGLGNALAMNAFCRQNGITWEEWKQYTAYELLRIKVQRARIPPEAVAAYFEANRNQLKMVCLARIVTRGRDECEQVKRMLEQGEAEFSQIARERSIEPNTRIAGGYLGCFKRGMLPDAIETEVFQAPEKAVVGPFPQNDFWAIYKVEESQHVQLTESLAKHIQDKLFFEWLREAVQNAPA